MNTTNPFPLESCVDPSRAQRLLLVVAALLVAAPWFWPVLAGPLPAMLPDLFAWTCGALLLGLFPWIQGRVSWVVASGLVIAAVGSSLLALVQYFDYDELFGLWVATTSPGHVTANVHQTNMLATLLTTGLWALWYLTATRQMTKRLGVAFGVLVVTGIAATASRTGMVQLLLLCGLVIFWSPSQRKVYFTAALALGVFYFAIAQLLPLMLEMLRDTAIDRNLVSRFSGDAGCASRRVVWDNVFQLISLKPWFGWGTGELMYAQYITPFEGVRYCQKMSNAHNLFLQIAVTMGVPFGLLCVALAGAAIFKAQPWKAANPKQKLGWGILVAIILHSMLEYPIWFGVFQILALQAFLLILLEERGQFVSQNPRPVKKQRSHTFIASSFGLLTLLSLVFWDYLKVSQLYIPREWRLPHYKEDTLSRSRDTILFKAHVLIAQVVTTPATPENAERLLAGALESLRTAPDPRVIKQVIAAASIVGRQDLVSLHTARFEAAWPKDYAEWMASQPKLGNI